MIIYVGLLVFLIGDLLPNMINLEPSLDVSAMIERIYLWFIGFVSIIMEQYNFGSAVKLRQ